MKRSFSIEFRRCGAAAVIVAVFVPVLLAVAALAVDVGHMYNVRGDLQSAADATALSAVALLPNEALARTVALEYADRNHGGYGTVLASSDVDVGRWSDATAAFTADAEPFNAVRVTLRRSEANGNPVNLFFAHIFGVATTGISASATAFDRGSAGRVRFLIDDESFDTDEPAIEELAEELDMTTEELLSDEDGDGFIDMPPTVIELPTGQVGDEGLFAIGDGFEFTETSDPSLVDFLLYDSNGDRRGISDSDLDPLIGVEPVSDPSVYHTYVNPDQVLVSPLYKSDVSNTTPGVQAKGERRGLVAFQIIGVGSDPDGGGSKLPNLIFEIVDPAGIDLLSLGLGGASAAQVTLVE